MFGQVNLTFSPRRWIQPDVTVLHALPKTDEEDRWIPAHLCTMAAEFFTLGKFGGYDTVARAVGGRRLSADLPFPIDFDPADLLP
ncbi:hypothetical protein ACTMS2_20410 [Micromonospora sp. SD12]|uniref:hypothetical protein n=1 Tax=Micromonospora sp. SD12 TaxID=3452216 RepID=UPI003F8893B9